MTGDDVLNIVPINLIRRRILHHPRDLGDEILVVAGAPQQVVYRMDAGGRLSPLTIEQVTVVGIKVPRRVVILSDLPRVGNAKIARAKLRRSRVRPSR
jgi:acyl-CoA synthetase (AMP-forming)/AMP-acid ligase II